MTYTLEIPKKYLGELVVIREQSTLSMRSQVLPAIEAWINWFNTSGALRIVTRQEGDRNVE